ncbi:MAG: hypothetical protein ACPG4T_12435 [Nannocystaceae bacterium]
MSRKARLRVGLSAGLAMLALPGCNHTEGQVELHWAFLDRDSAPVVPGNSLTLPDTCSLLGTLDPDIGETRYALEVVLHTCLSSCTDGCLTDPACQVIAPQRFSCETTRATVDLPASEDPYLFATEVVARQEDSETCACAISSTCVATPGSRLRKVLAGLVTDLQVQQMVLTTLDFAGDFDSDRNLHLDLATCCEPSETCN